MYKLIIIDDNQYIIDGIRSSIDLDSLNISFCESAYSGKEGLRIISEINPDIVIVDIELPDMSGIDIIKSALKSGYSGEFIILSGHSEFCYAQAAISLNVVDYLLKPISPVQLTESLQQATIIIEQAKSNASLQQQLNNNLPIITGKFIEELFSAEPYSEAEFIKKINFLGLPLEDKAFRCLSIKIDFLSCGNASSELYKKTVELKLLSWLSEALDLKNTHISFKNNICYYLLYFDASTAASFSDDVLNKVLSNAGELFKTKYDASLCFYLGDVVSSYKDIRSSYLQSKECMKKSFLITDKKIVFYNDISKYSDIGAYLVPYDKPKLLNYISKQDFTTAKEYIHSILRSFSKKDIAYTKLVSHEILSTVLEALYNIKSDDTNVIDVTNILYAISAATTCDELYSFFNSFFDTLENMFSVYAPSNDILFRKIENYIGSHYSENITLDILSKLTYCSPSYISKLFLKNAGTSFKEYLTNVRMQKAYTLLSSGKYKIYEVSEMVGYKKVDYFRKLFKQYFDKNPAVIKHLLDTED